MLKLCIRSLPPTTTEEALNELFSNYGTVRSLYLPRDIFTGKARGLAFIEMEGHEARAAIAALDNSDFEGSTIRVGLDRPRKNTRGRRGRR